MDLYKLEVFGRAVSPKNDLWIGPPLPTLNARFERDPLPRGAMVLHDLDADPATEGERCLATWGRHVLYV